MKIILGCDTSCDDTAIGIIKVDEYNNINILSNVRITQTEACLKYGGVVPEVIARNHLKDIDNTFNIALSQAQISIDDIDYFSSTVGPGLIGGLIVGSSFIKTISTLKKKPFIAIHHLEGHIASAQCNDSCLAVVISGGHSLIVKCELNKPYEILCKTLDDSAGEVFDKIGRLMGFDFPAGVNVEKLALKAKKTFKIPNITQNKLEFSFSGLKTKCKQMLEVEKHEDVALFLQQTVAEHLKNKITIARNITGINKVVVCGGVASNKYIRDVLNFNFECIFPPMGLCVDNGVMIAIAANNRIKNNQKINVFYDEFASMSLEKWNNFLQN